MAVVFYRRAANVAHGCAANAMHHVAAFLFVEAFMAFVALAYHGLVDPVLDADAHVAFGLLLDLVASQRQVVWLLAVS